MSYQNEPSNQEPVSQGEITITREHLHVFAERKQRTPDQTGVVQALNTLGVPSYHASIYYRWPERLPVPYHHAVLSCQGALLQEASDDENEEDGQKGPVSSTAVNDQDSSTEGDLSSEDEASDDTTEETEEAAESTPSEAQGGDESGLPRDTLSDEIVDENPNEDASETDSPVEEDAEEAAEKKEGDD